MTLEDFSTAKQLQEDIDSISALQTALATPGAKVVINITKSDGTSILKTHADLSEVMTGDYDTIATTALSSFNAQLTSLKAAKQSSFDAIGEA